MLIVVMVAEQPLTVTVGDQADVSFSPARITPVKFRQRSRFHGSPREHLHGQVLMVQDRFPADVVVLVLQPVHVIAGCARDEQRTDLA